MACLGAEKERPMTGDAADYVASANLSSRPVRTSISISGLAEPPDYVHDDQAYIRDSRLEQAQMEHRAFLREPGGLDDVSDSDGPGSYGSRGPRWRDGF